MKVLRYTVMTFLSVLLFLTLFTYVQSKNAYDTFNNPENLKSTFESTGLYTYLADTVIDSFSQLSEGQNDRIKNILDSSVKETITPEWIKIRVEPLLDSFWANIEGSSTTFGTVDISDLRESILKNLQEELEGVLPNAQIDFVITTFGNEIPYEIEASQFIDGLDPTIFPKLRTIDQNFLQINNQLIVISILISLLIIMISMSLTTILRWFGSLFFLMFLVLLAVENGIPQVTSFIVSQMGQNDIFQESLNKIVVSLLSIYSDSLFEYTIMFIILSIVFIGVSFIPPIKSISQSILLYSQRNKVITFLRTSIILALLAGVSYSVLSIINSVITINSAF